jgi:hydroxyethylthiazole kinase-like uncharacterized protein yjeF
MKVLTAAQMREVDRLTIERGIPGIILMENAGVAVVEFLRRTFAPLNRQRIVVICGKGNNGGDGFVIGRQLFQHRSCEQLTVIEGFGEDSLSGDAAQARRALAASGCPVLTALPEHALNATIVIDAVLGTGIKGPVTGRALDLIQTINKRFPHASKVAVDIPSGFPSDLTSTEGEYVHADYTVTFTALKLCQALSPSYEAMGVLEVVPIGTPDELCQTNSEYTLHQTTQNDLTALFKPRKKDSNKGLYGHVAVLGGSVGKSGAPAMSGLSALRIGAGLVTVGSAAGAISSIASVSPELMTEPLPQTESGHVGTAARSNVNLLLKNKTVLALGPGLGMDTETVNLVRDLYQDVDLPCVVDADGLNAIAGAQLRAANTRILTPHPGEMSRLTGKTTKEVQACRLQVAESFARDTNSAVVLKGDRTIIAFPDGETWINPTGSPAMSTGGTGDVLTGMIAGMIAQHPSDWQRAVVAAVWLHGRAGEIGAGVLGEQCLIATDLLRFLPDAIESCRAAV